MERDEEVTGVSGVPMFSILHTTARVPDGWHSAHDAWLAGCANPGDVEYILAVDNGSLIRSAAHMSKWGKIGLAINHGEKCSTAGWNSAAQASTGKVLVCIADDLFPSAQPKWDDQLRVRLGTDDPVTDPLVINPDFGHGVRRDCISFSICSRARYQQLGYVVYPEYGPMYPDDDWAFQSYHDGVVVECPEIKWEHRWLGADHDEVYRRQNHPDNYRRGWEVFQRRWPEEAARRGE